MWYRFRRKILRFRYSGHLSPDINQPPVLVAKVLLEPLNRGNHPVGIPIFPCSIVWIWLAYDYFLSKRYDSLGEPDGIREYKEHVPLHFLVHSTSNVCS